MKRALILFTVLGACASRTSAPTPATPLEARYLAQPGDAKVNFELGFEAERQGDFLRADQYYRRVEQLVADAQLRALARHRIVVVLVRSHRLQEAYDRCRSQLAENSSDRSTRYLLAAILSSLERPREAERELETLRRTSPDDATVYLELGKLYRDMFGDRVRADRMFRHYLALAPKGTEAETLRFEMETHRMEAQDLQAMELLLRGASDDGGVTPSANPTMVNP